MKERKEIPKPVKMFLFLYGFWVGLFSMVVIFALNAVNSTLGFNAFVALLAVALVLMVIVMERYREVLVEWGIIKPKKKKA